MLLDKTPSWPMAMNCGCKCHQPPHMAANYQCQYKISETLLNSCVWHAWGLCIVVSLPKEFAVVNYTTYYLQTRSVHHQCTGDSLFNYPYTLFIIKSLHYAMVSGYHTTNENKSYYHSSHKSKSVSWNKSSTISYTKIWYSLAWSGPLHSDWHLCIKHHLVSNSQCFTMPNPIEIGPNPRMLATLGNNMGAILSKMQMKPNTKTYYNNNDTSINIRAFPNSNHLQKNCVTSPWAAREGPLLKKNHPKLRKSWVPKPSFVHALPVGSLSISQTNGIWRKQTFKC